MNDEDKSKGQLIEELGEMRRQEEALRKSEAKYRLIAENVGDVIWQLDPHYCFTYVSHSVEKFLGYTPEEVIGRPLTSFLTPEGVHMVEALRADGGGGNREGLRVLQLDFAAKDGKIVRAEVCSSAAFDTCGGLVSYQGVTRDVTEREASARELRWKTALLEAQINSSLDGILVVDSNGQKVLQNRRIADMWKIPQHIVDDSDDSVQARYVAEMAVNPGEFLDKVKYLYAHPGETSRDEIELKDGTVLDRYSAPVLGTDGTDYGRVWTFHDITDRKRAEETLRRKTSFLEALVYSSHDGILVVSDGKKILQNHRVAELWKIPKEIAEQDDIEAQVTAIMKMTKDPEGFREKALEFDSHPRDSWHGEVELVDGTILDRDSYPVEGADGEYYGRLWTFHDITEPKRAAEALRTSRLQLAEAVDLARIVYWEYDGAADQFVFNDAFYALYGTTAEAEGGYLMAREEYRKRFVHPDDREEMTRQVRENRDHNQGDHLEQYEHRGLRRDGEVMHILNRSRISVDRDGNVVRAVGVNQDITARKKMEEALREGADRLKLALSASHMGVWERNVATGEVFWSPQCYELFGSPDFDGTFESFATLLHPEDAPRILAVAGNMSTDRPTSRAEFRIVRPGGNLRWLASLGQGYFDATGVLVRMVGIVHDVTEQKEAGEALRRSEERFHSLFETSKDSILFIEQATVRIVGANPAACDLYGYSLEELLSMKVTDVSAEPEKTEKSILQSILDVPLRLHRKKDGTVFPVEISGGFFMEGPNRLHTAFIRDISDRKKAEEQLLIANFGVQSSISAIGFADPTGRITFINRSFVKLWGYEREDEVLGRHISEFAMLGAQEEGVRAARSGHGYIGEGQAKRKDGSPFNVQVVVSEVKTDEGKPVCMMASFIDITERKVVEEALRESETKLRAILDGSRDAIGVSKNGIRTFVNPAYVSLFGFERVGDLIGKPVIELIAPESRAFVADMVEKREKGEPAPSFYEVTAMRKDGTTFLMESTVSLYTLKGELFTLVILRDVTERRRAEEEIRMLKHSIDVHYDGAYWINTDDEIVYVNEAACRSLGYEREELIGQTTYLIDPLSTPEEIARAWEGLRKNGSYLGESIHRRKDGSEFPVEIVTSYVQFGGREFACGFARDITEKKRFEEQLRQAQKMEAVGTLAGGVAHDFNNILTVILGFANLMQMSMGKDDIHRPHVDQIVASSERAAELTRSLLAFSRKQRIALEPHEVNGVVTSTVKLLSRLLPEDISLAVQLTDGETSTMLDVTQIGQVLMNLATNGRDAMPHGGSLTIKTERARIDEEFEKTHGFGVAGEYVKLSVSDTGMGMDASTVKRIFEPFFTTKEVGKGTGLGLASAYGIVKQHNGYITVSSVPFKGTTFDIYLPLLAVPSSRETPEIEEVKGGAETILIVEDDPNVRFMLTEILESQGYTTIEAADGDDAVRVHKERAGEIDLVILDVVMPGKNGKQAFDEISRSDPRVKAIFVSGYTGDVVIGKGVQSEGVDFLHKPIGVAELLAKVREVLDR